MGTHQENSIRVGMIALSDLSDPNPVSGMPYRMAKALRDQGIEILEIPARSPVDRSTLTRRALERSRGIYDRRAPLGLKGTIDRALPARARARAMEKAERHSAYAQLNLENLLRRGERIDALFGCCISSALYNFRSDLPIIYFSDATSTILQRTYPVFATRGEARRRAVREIELAGLRRTTVAVFASTATRTSAIDEFGMDPAKTVVVPMGAHVYPEDPGSVHAPAQAPTRESCDLLIVAKDPIRKRVDLAVEMTELLRDRGILATLHVVGPGTTRSNASQAVRSVGALMLSDPRDRARHQSLLRDCHLQVLPSLGEAFGIAPAESAHFARPSLVAGAGGLPDVVHDGQTGLVLPVDAGPLEWADAAERLVDDPEAYRAMSSRALDRARGELNWDAWGRRLRAIIEDTLGRNPTEQE